MPTLTIERRWTSGSAYAGLRVSLVYTVDNSSSPTKMTLSFNTGSNLTTTLFQSGSGTALTSAKNSRQTALSNGLTYSVNCKDASNNNKELISFILDNNLFRPEKSISYSYTKTHSSFTRGIWVRLSGVEHVSANMTINAKQSYSISYNGEGGSTPSPSSQTKWYGENITISSTTTKDDYTFLGWNTNSSATIATYKNGDIYTGNTGLSLHAIWKDNYTAPQLTIKSVSRCDYNGNINEETGNYAKVTFSWKIYHNKNNNNHPTFEVKINNNTITSSDNTSNKYSGETSIVHTNLSLSTENSYEVEVSIYDTYRGSNVTVTKKIFLPSVEYLIDIKSSGNGIAFGGVANKDNTVQVYYDVDFNGNIDYGNNPPFQWRTGTSEALTLTADEGKVYNFPSSNFTMPNISGYTRMVIPRTSNTNTVATGYGFNDDNTLNVYIRNLKSSSSNLYIRVFLFYLRNDLQWT